MKNRPLTRHHVPQEGGSRAFTRSPLPPHCLLISDNITLFSYFGHNFFNLTPIRSPFEPTWPSLTPLQDYEKNRTYLALFLTDFGNFQRRPATPTMLVLPRFFFDFLPSSCEIFSSFLEKFTPLSQEQALPLRMTQVSYFLRMIWDETLGLYL